MRAKPGCLRFLGRQTHIVRIILWGKNTFLGGKNIAIKQSDARIILIIIASPVQN